MPSPNDKLLAAIRPNLGHAALYKARLRKLIEAMHASTDYWLKAAYKRTPPAAIMAQDASPSKTLDRVVRKLARYWQKRFNDASQNLADYFSEGIAERSDRALASTLKASGISVKLKRTAAQNDIIQATIAQNVGLIKSIPQQYMGKVQQAVMRSVQQGRDLASLTAEIEVAYGVEYRRAALIARDQNNKATASLTKARQLELGIQQGVWMHSHAGKQPRPTHVKMHGKRFDLDKGMYDSAEGDYVMPGILINCRCSWKPVIAGFS